ncbi:CDP-glycerol glycerophosphotransferase family protein [Rarobacter faecitabidus]
MFDSFSGRRPAGSPLAIHEAIRLDPRFAGWDLVWVSRSPAQGTVRFRSWAYYRALATARVWVMNTTTPIGVRPRKGQAYLQTWHGTPLKRIGLDVVAGTEIAMSGKAEIDELYRAEGAKATWLLSQCEFTTQRFTDAFGLADRASSPIAEVGNPRNDALVLAGPDEVSAARSSLGIAAGQRAVLYAPTWRDNSYDNKRGYTFAPPFELSELRRALGEDTVLLYRSHYLASSIVDDSDAGVIDVSQVPDINTLLLASDVLVTDYSSSFFDYSLLDRPMVFFTYDAPEYLERLRGLYLSLDELPGPVVETFDSLVGALRGQDTFASKRAEFRQRFATWDDGKATGRVLDLLAQRLDGDSPAAR